MSETQEMGLWWQLPETRYERELRESGETPPHLRRDTPRFEGLKTTEDKGYLAERECQRCGAGFTAKSATAKFCSSVCKQAARLEGRTATCKACGDTFTHRSDAQPRFCSPMCVAKGSR